MKPITTRRLLLWVAVSALVVAPLAWLARYDDRGRPMYRAQCTNNLKQIALALHNYHLDYGSLPPSLIADAQGRPLHSWRVLILPYLEQQTLYDRYNFAEPWDGPNNRKLADEIPYVYICPCREEPRGSWTSYLAVTGPGTAFPGALGISLDEVADGTGRTLAVVEAVTPAAPWTEPRDLDLNFLGNPLPGRPAAPSSFHAPAGANVALLNGSVPYLPPGLPPATLRALATIDGGESVAFPKHPAWP